MKLLMERRADKREKLKSRITMQQQNGATFYLQKFYTQCLWTSMHRFPRGKIVGFSLIVLRFLLWQLIAFNDEILEKIRSTDSYLQLFTEIYPLQSLDSSDSNSSLSGSSTILLIFFVFNCTIALALCMLLIIFTHKEIQMKYDTSKQNPTLSKENQLQTSSFERSLQNLLNNYLSFTIRIYIYAIFAISLYISVADSFSFLSVTNIVLTLLIGLIAKDVDYEYQLTSQDFLRMRFSNLSYALITCEGILILAIASLSNTPRLVLKMAMLCMYIVYNALIRPFFEERVLRWVFSISVYLLFANAGFVYVLENESKKNSGHFLEVYLLILIPFTIRFTEVFQKYVYEHKLEKVGDSSMQYRKSSSTQRGIANQGIIDHFMREKVATNKRIDSFDESDGENNRNDEMSMHRMLDRLFIKQQIIKSILNHNEFDEFEDSIESEYENDYPNKQNNNLTTQNNHSGGAAVAAALDSPTKNQLHYHQDTADSSSTKLKSEIWVNGQQYVHRNTFLLDDSQVERKFHALVKLLRQQSRKKSQSSQLSQLDISYLIFLLEIQKNYQLFELTAIECESRINMKSSQIIASLRAQAIQKMSLERYKYGSLSIFDSSLVNVISFDHQIDNCKEQLSSSIEKKLDLLIIMKQKFIDIEQLQTKLRDLLLSRRQLSNQIKNLIRVNPLSGQLSGIYYTYLETLAFSDQDLRTKQIRQLSLKRANGNSSNAITNEFQVAKYSLEGTCVLFSSLQTDSTSILKKVSHNFTSIFGLNPIDILKKPLTALMPNPYQRMHATYLKNFFNRGDSTSKLEQKLLFAQVHNDYIIPVCIDLKVNYDLNEKLENEFGLSGFLKSINKDKLYILYDSKTTRVVSVTSRTHSQLFASFDNFTKINLPTFFPFISKFHPLKPLKSMRLVNTFSKITSQLQQPNHNNNSVKQVIGGTHNSNTNSTIPNMTSAPMTPGNAAAIQPTGIIGKITTLQLESNNILMSQTAIPAAAAPFDIVSPSNQNQPRSPQLNQITTAANLMQQTETDILNRNNSGLLESTKNRNNNINNNNNGFFNNMKQSSSSTQHQLESAKSIGKYIRNTLQSTDLTQTTATTHQLQQQQEMQNAIEEIKNVEYLLITPILLNKKKIAEKKRSTNFRNNNQQQQSQADELGASEKNDDQSTMLLTVEKYQFFLMEISIESLSSAGITHIKYIELSNVRRLNPFLNAPLLLQIQKSASTTIRSNYSHFKKAILKVLLQELHQIAKTQLLTEQQQHAKGIYSIPENANGGISNPDDDDDENENEDNNNNNNNNNGNTDDNLADNTNDDQNNILFNQHGNYGNNRRSSHLPPSFGTNNYYYTTEQQAHEHSFNNNSQRTEQQQQVINLTLNSQVNNRKLDLNSGNVHSAIENSLLPFISDNALIELSGNSLPVQSTTSAANKKFQMPLIDQSANQELSPQQQQQQMSFLEKFALRQLQKQPSSLENLDRRVGTTEMVLGNIQMPPKLIITATESQKRHSLESLQSPFARQGFTADQYQQQQVTVNDLVKLDTSVASNSNQNMHSSASSHQIFNSAAIPIGGNNNNNNYMPGSPTEQITPNALLQGSLLRNQNNENGIPGSTLNPSLVIELRSPPQEPMLKSSELSVIKSSELTANTLNYMNSMRLKSTQQHGMLHGNERSQELIVNSDSAHNNNNNNNRSNFKSNKGTNNNNNTNTAKITDEFVNEQSKERFHTIHEAQDLSSNHSKESSASSNRREMRSLIMSTKRLGIMRIVNTFGILSLLVIIVVVIWQYFDIQNQFNTFEKDLKIVGWPTWYTSDVSIITKDVNLQKLIKHNVFTLSDGQNTAYLIGNDTQAEVVSSLENMKVLLNQLSNTDSDRLLFQNIRNKDSYFQVGANYNNSIPLNQQLSTTYFQLFRMDVKLMQALQMIVIYTYRFAYGYGLGSGQFLTMTNEYPLGDALEEVSADSLNSSDDSLQSIQSSLVFVVVILVAVVGAGVFIAVPLYWLIQKKKQQLIALFGTFSLSIIQKEFTEVYSLFIRMSGSTTNHTTAYKLAEKSMASHSNEKRQNLSSTSNLPKFNANVLFMAIFAFALTLPYPIINSVVANNYITESLDMLGLIKQLYELERVIIKSTGLHYFCMNLRINQVTNPYKYEEYRNEISTLLVEGQTARTEVANSLREIRKLTLHDEQTFDEFFFAMFEGNICRLMTKYADRFVTGFTFSETECVTIYDNLLSQGLTIATTFYLDFFPSLYTIYEISDYATLMQEFNEFQLSLKIEQFYKLERYLTILYKTASQFIIAENSAFKDDLFSSLNYLLIYQFSILSLIFSFSWLLFYRNMDQELNDSKQYLSIMNINFLISNPYVHNYLYNNMD